jgi:hypothetical protein
MVKYSVNFREGTPIEEVDKIIPYLVSRGYFDPKLISEGPQKWYIVLMGEAGLDEETCHTIKNSGRVRNLRRKN